MDETRKVAHRMLDELPDRFVLAAKNAIGDLKLAAAREFHEVLTAAVDDDEPVLPEDVAALEGADADHHRGESRPWHDRHDAPARTAGRKA